MIRGLVCRQATGAKEAGVSKTVAAESHSSSDWCCGRCWCCYSHPLPVPAREWSMRCQMAKVWGRMIDAGRS